MNVGYGYYDVCFEMVVDSNDVQHVMYPMDAMDMCYVLDIGTILSMWLAWLNRQLHDSLIYYHLTECCGLVVNVGFALLLLMHFLNV